MCSSLSLARLALAVGIVASIACGTPPQTPADAGQVPFTLTAEITTEPDGGLWLEATAWTTTPVSLNGVDLVRPKDIFCLGDCPFRELTAGSLPGLTADGSGTVLEVRGGGAAGSVTCAELEIASPQSLGASVSFGESVRWTWEGEADSLEVAAVDPVTGVTVSSGWDENKLSPGQRQVSLVMDLPMADGGTPPAYWINLKGTRLDATGQLECRIIRQQLLLVH
jgi:hypothetical protein